MNTDKEHIKNEPEIIDCIESYINDDIELLISNKQIKLGNRELPDFDAYSLYQKIAKDIQHQETSKIKKIDVRTVIRWASACVIAVLFLNVGYYIYQDRESNKLTYQEVYSARGEKLLVLLPDGSRVWLNADSKLIYPERFAKSKREVSLVGEAYFEIKKNSQAPFLVSAEDMQIRVTGTSFNVKAYPNDKVITTTLVEGSICIGHSRSKSPFREMVLGQTAVYDKRRNVCSIEDNNYYQDVSSWKQNQLVFRNTPLEEVLDILSRQFDVNFEIKNPQIAHITYTFIGKGSDISSILETMKSITPIQIEKISSNDYILR